MLNKLLLVCLLAVSCVTHTATNAINKFAQSIYLIQTVTNTDQTHFGTAFAFYSTHKADGMLALTKTYFLTNFHNIEDSKTDNTDNLLYLPQPLQTGIPGKVPTGLGLPYTIEFYDDKLDVAVVSVLTSYNIPTLSLDAAPAQLGDRVLSIGYPLGQGLLPSQGFVGYFYPGAEMVVSSPIIFGNSGGPVINFDTGKVIAVTKGIAVLNTGLANTYVFHMQSCIPVSFFLPLITSKGLP